MKILKIFLNRIFIFSFLICFQIILLVSLGRELLSLSAWIHPLMRIISFIVVLWLVNKNENPSYKISWIIVVLLFPLFGGMLYLLFGNKKPSRKIRRILQPVLDEMSPYNLLESDASSTIPDARKDGITYLSELGYGTYLRTQCRYYSLGDYCYRDLLKDIRNAKKYIFMEYFIVSEGLMFESILKILAQKVQEGVEVRFIYDDVGSITSLPYRFEKKLEKLGIQCVVFNPFIPLVSVAMNHRDHRKICIIDGYIGYSGGFNLADEYINAKVRFGHWKDTGIRLEGEGVWNLTTMFLSTWNAYKHQDHDYWAYRPQILPPIQDDGYVVAYGDSPVDHEETGENMYLNMIHQAQEEILIMTPYFIIDETMMKAFLLARRKGVRIQILTPGIPDKQNVYHVTRSYYYSLIKEGVEFYEYQPGFLHAKMVLCDRRIATVGTINFDYRSLYLHFECNVLMTQKSVIEDIYKDFQQTLVLCRKVTQGQSRRFRGIYEAILRLFAPLL